MLEEATDLEKCGLWSVQLLRDSEMQVCAVFEGERERERGLRVCAAFESTCMLSHFICYLVVFYERDIYIGGTASRRPDQFEIWAMRN